MIRRPRSGRPKGFYPGQMHPFSLEQVSRLERILQADKSDTAVRDLALLRLGVDSAFRSSYVLKLTWQDLAPNGEISASFCIHQKKTGMRLNCELLPKSVNALAAWMAICPDTSSDALVFAICSRQHNRIVKQWAGKLGLDQKLYGTHSVRRTKPSHVYRQTHNIVAMQQLLGHRSPANTALYLAVDNADALDLARKFPI